MIEIFGENEVDNVVITAHKLFSRDPGSKHWIHYPDVQGYLQEELAGAHRFLMDPAHRKLWEYCSEDLVNAIHSRNTEKVERIRERFADLGGAAHHRRDVT